MLVNKATLKKLSAHRNIRVLQSVSSNKIVDKPDILKRTWHSHCLAHIVTVKSLAVKRKRNIDYIFISLQLILNVGDDGNYGSL